MKKIIASFLGFIVAFVGVVCCSIYIQNKITIGSAIIGIVGLLIINPAFEAWKKYFLELFDSTNKDVDANQQP
jgi:hypothetical protein